MEYIIAIIVIIILIFLVQYNGLVRSKKKVQQAYSTIDVYLTQRFDLIPNLVDCVKAYTKHESDLFEKIAEMRTSYMNTKSLTEAESLNNECNRLIAYMENYPDLKASTQYLELQKKLSKLESQLQAARRIYNAEVTAYNTKISVVPSNIIAKMFNFKEEKLFKVEDVKAKDNIKLNTLQ